ncbi:MAG: hypothetical protein KHY39_00960 [Clostridiaceae bacterium]|nr:hypothetical protein [Clostridiaceae bacterium]
MSEPITIGMVASVIIGVLVYLAKMMINDIKSSISGFGDRLDTAMKSFDERIDKVEEKHEKDMKQVQAELNNIKSDFPMTFVLREDYFRTMNSVEGKMTSIDEKLSKLLLNSVGGDK